jgi:hypothetical protein
MRKKNGIIIASTSLVMLAGASAWADDAPAKPAIPSIADILMSSGVTATGYVDATFSAFHYSGSSLSYGDKPPPGTDTFTFQQAGLTLAYQPASGFGVLINPVIAPYSLYANNYNSAEAGSPSFQLFQGFVQYAQGPWTVIAGKFATLAGAEVYAPPGNTNVTRSLLFGFQPLTHTGARGTFVLNPMVTFNFGVNNGYWNSGDETAPTPGKTLEVNATLTPIKALTWSLTNYYGRESTNYGLTEQEFFDTVATYTVNSQLTLVGNFDYSNIAAKNGLPSADWFGFAGYVNYQINPMWRVSLRGEYIDDHKGYLTEGYYEDEDYYVNRTEEDLTEVTLTFGWDPISHLEFRIEGRYDDPQSVKSPDGGPNVNLFPKTEQAWLEALWKF